MRFIGNISFAENSGFSDVSENHIYAEAIEYAQEKNIVKGYKDGTFQPKKKINRAEFTKIIIESIFNSSEISDCEIDSEKFSDISNNDWFAPYICVAVEENIISGYPDKTFRPSQEISFVESAKIIDIAFGGEETHASPWYAPYVKNLGDSSIIPQEIQQLDQKISRGEMTEMVWRMQEEQRKRFGFIG